jgi:Asp-tRNA(Asn)/Glu-tRNA(Gln) amidotransferase C subunit
MSQRKAIQAGTIQALAAELADLRLTPDKAAAHAAMFEPMLQGIDALRKLDLKDVDPALIFHPIEDSGEAGR